MQTGLDRLLADPARLASLRTEKFALLCHPASVSRELEHILSALARVDVTPVLLFGPEHGIDGHAQDMITVGDDAPAARSAGPRVRSLYGDSEAELSPRPEDLAGIDRVVIDLQDIGARYYTFVWSAVLMLRACARAGVPVLVLDRPNPLGRAVEGRMHASNTYLSFVGLEPTPARHGLTLGEIVAWRASVEGVAPHLLTVLTASDEDESQWDRPMVAPSPNMPNAETAVVYPGGCLLEGTNLSEGRGTTRPFLLWGAPWMNADRIADSARAFDLRGVVVRPHVFEPKFHKFGNERVRGVEMHVLDRAAFEPVRAYASLIAACAQMHPDAFRFRTERYEYRSDVPAIDLLTGGAAYREAVLHGDDPAQIGREFAGTGEPEAHMVRAARDAVRLYAS